MAKRHATVGGNGPAYRLRSDRDGRSEKLSPSGPDRYRYTEHRDYLFALWDTLDLGNRVVLVLDDWGAVLGIDWARHNSQRVQGIVHMETVAAPLNWSDLPEQAHPLFKALRSPEGERLVLQENIFIEKILPQAVIRQLTDEELNYYGQPFRNSGEDRRPMLAWPRSLPIATSRPEAGCLLDLVCV